VGSLVPITTPIFALAAPGFAILARDARHDSCNLVSRREDVPMLMTIAVLLLILWLLGMVSTYTLGGFIHLLLLLAVVVVLVRIIQGRRPV
jgi:hypothetical protein